MNIGELEKVLIKLKVRKNTYSLLKVHKDERYCISKESNHWSVYYSEKGQRTGEQIFKTEALACEYFLNQIKKDLESFI